MTESRCPGTLRKMEIQFVNGGARKKSAVALSTCEAEYYAMTMAAQEIVWLCRVLTEAGIAMDSATPLRSDSQLVSASYFRDAISNPVTTQ